MRARNIALVAVLGGCGDDGVPPAADASSSDDTTSPTSTSAPVSGDDSSNGSVTSTTGSDVTSVDAADGSESGATFNIDLCGDGEIHAGEECDDGNRMDGDACSAACQRTFDIVWTVTHDGPISGHDMGLAGIVDEQDAIYVVGRQQHVADGVQLWLRKYDASGTAQWTLTSSGPEGLGAAGAALAWSIDGDLLLFGSTVSQTSGNDILVMTVDRTTAAIVDEWTIDAPGDGSDPPIHAGAIAGAVDEAGNIVLVGAFGGSGEDPNLWIGKVSPTGALQWQDGPVAEGSQHGRSVVVSSDGTIHVAAYIGVDPFTGIFAYSPDGVALGEVSLGLPGIFAIQDLAPTASGEILIGGNDAVGVAIYRANEDWTLTWQAHGPHVVTYAVADGSEGTAHVAGSQPTRGSPDAWAGGFHADGSPWWGDVHDDPDANGQDEWQDVVVDSTGDVIVIGYETTVDEARNILVRKYHPLP